MALITRMYRFEGFERRYKAFVSPFKAFGWRYKALYRYDDSLSRL